MPAPDLYAEIKGNAIDGYEYHIVSNGRDWPWVYVSKDLSECRAAAKASLALARRRKLTEISETVYLDD